MSGNYEWAVCVIAGHGCHRAYLQRLGMRAHTVGCLEDDLEGGKVDNGEQHRHDYNEVIRVTKKKIETNNYQKENQ